ncbi:caspase family protein [Flavobacterium cupreum]|uniref:Caspase family protein n=2 Tax=Flavobacterium TaxID=237 RepID=A0A434ACM6_9FLAO|nr:caspase family protein [Flavobacterium cupreum]RUT72122.1 caspase family protein [Flavobacterium cupreum]
MNYAIVIGIDHYEKKPLSGAVADAKAFADWLETKGGVQKENLKLFVSNSEDMLVSGPEIDIAIDTINRAARNNSETNRLYFYFSGHGIGVTFDNTALCLRLWPALINHCISGLDYRTWFTNAGAFDEVLIFFDCCREHDTLIKGNSPAGSWNLPIGNRNPKVLICNSTAYGKLSYEVILDPVNENNSPGAATGGPAKESESDKKRGAFTTFLIDSLNGDADSDGTGQITALALKDHIRNNFKSHAEKFKKTQDASADTLNGGDQILICTVPVVLPQFNCEITFERNSNITLYGPNLEDLWTGDVVDGQVLQRNLDKGFYQLKDNRDTTLPPKNFTNYSPKTISYERF